MFKFPPELNVHRGNVVYLLYVAGGLLMTVTAGTQCVDAAVRTAHDPAKLLRLSNALLALMGLGHQNHGKTSLSKRKQRKRLHFSESLCRLLDAITAAQRGSHDFTRLMQFPGPPEKSTCSNNISVKRCGICYILIWGARGWTVLALCKGHDSTELRATRPLHRLVHFTRTAQQRGDTVTLLVGGQAAGIGTEPRRNDDSKERTPSRLSLVSSALSVLLLWTLLPHIALCVIVLLGWKVQKHLHRAVLSQISSK